MGRRAPDFHLPCVADGDGEVTNSQLSDFAGEWLALVFYPRDFTFVCPTELLALSDRQEEFASCNCRLLGISVDSLETHRRWLRTPVDDGGVAGLAFPLASDRGGHTAKRYGVYLDEEGVSQRGLFLIDPEGVLQYAVVHNQNVGRSTSEVLRILAALRSGGLCAADWGVGSPGLDLLERLHPGTVLSKYTIVEKIASGGCGSVFEALDTELERTVALKIVKPEMKRLTRAVMAEARAAAAVTHPNICTIYDVDDAAGLPVIAMELLSGNSLDRMLELGPMPLEECRRVGRQIAQGLAAAQAAGISHGDLKPANIMVTKSGVAKLLDFGLARHSRPDAKGDRETGDEAAEGLTGTPFYMSPEQIDGERPTSRSDVFSFGLVLFEMLTGRKAATGKTLLAVLSSILRLDAERCASEVPEPFAGILRRALVHDRTVRSMTMQETAEILV